MTEDALGSVRVTTNSFGEVKARRDFLPFGEELYAGLAGRNANQKYSSNTDDTRRKFATYQRDVETGLDFAQSRFYSPMHGRFTSPDEFKGGPDELFDFEEDASDNPTFYADLTNPQSLNKYQYGYNNPYKFVDPLGLESVPHCWNGICSCYTADDEASRGEVATLTHDVGQAAEQETVRKIKFVGGTLDEQNAVRSAIETLRSQSSLVNDEPSKYEGSGEGPELTIEIRDNETFDKVYKNDKTKNPLGAAENDGEISNGRGVDVDDPAGYSANLSIVIRQGSINATRESQERSSNRETLVEGILSHEIGHARDIRSDPRGFGQRSIRDRDRDYHTREIEVRADLFLKQVAAQRVVSSGVSTFRP